MGCAGAISEKVGALTDATEPLIQETLWEDIRDGGYQWLIVAYAHDPAYVARYRVMAIKDWSHFFEFHACEIEQLWDTAKSRELSQLLKDHYHEVGVCGESPKAIGLWERNSD